MSQQPTQPSAEDAREAIQRMGKALENLTPRQLQIARLISQEKTDKEIARELSIKVGTVKTISGMAKLKVGAKGRVGLALWYVLHYGY